MTFTPNIQKLLIFFCLLFSIQWANGQFKLKGTVYDSSRTVPVQSVSVQSTGGRGTITNGFGKYEITVSETDSVWFSYLNKPTIKFPVAKIMDATRFDIALPMNVEILREITIRPRNYRLDSIQNRQDYAKAFEFQRPNISTMTSIGPMGAGIDINELIRVFQFRKNNSMVRFKERLLTQEREKYIDHRFNKALVRRLTQLDSADLELFMRLFRPPFEFTVASTDFQFQTYIKDSYEVFLREYIRQRKSF